MKRAEWVLFPAVMIGILGGCSTAGAEEPAPAISVSGEACVNVVPDKVLVTLGIETQDMDVITAKKKNNDILKAAQDVARACGVPDREMQTDFLSVEPRWHEEHDQRTFLGYFVRNTLAVTLADPAKTEELLSKCLGAGVNYVHGIDFQATEYKKYREQAREMALKAAREKAEKMAAVLGQTLGPPKQISEGGGGGYGRAYYGGWWGRGSASTMSQNSVQNIQGATGEMPEGVALGKIAIQASVAVTFSLTQPK